MNVLLINWSNHACISLIANRKYLMKLIIFIVLCTCIYINVLAYTDTMAQGQPSCPHVKAGLSSDTLVGMYKGKPMQVYS